MLKIFQKFKISKYITAKFSRISIPINNFYPKGCNKYPRLLSNSQCMSGKIVKKDHRIMAYMENPL